MTKRKRSTSAQKPFKGTDDALADPGDVDPDCGSDYFEPTGNSEEDEYLPVTSTKASKVLRKPPKKGAKSKPCKTGACEGGDEPPAEREPQFDSDYVPIPFKGRLGYVRFSPSMD